MQRQAVCDGDRFVRRLAPQQAADRVQHINHLQLAARQFKSQCLSLRIVTSPVRQRFEPQRFHVFDAPGLQDDFYTQPLSWSKHDWLAVALGSKIWARFHSKKQGDSPTCLNKEALDLINMETGFDSDMPNVDALQWDHEGRRLAFATGSPCVTLSILDAETKQLSMTLGKSRFSPIKCLAWTNGSLACGGDKGDLLLLDPRQNLHIHAHSFGSCRISGMSWSPSCQLLAVGSNDNSVQVWDTRHTERPVCKFTHSSSAVKALAWSSNYTLFAGGGKVDCCLRKYNCELGELLAASRAQSQFTSLFYNSEERELVSTHRLGGGGIAKWSAANASLIHSWPQLGSIVGAALGNCGKELVTGDSREFVSLWQIWPMTGKSKKLSYIDQLRQRSAIR